MNHSGPQWTTALLIPTYTGPDTQHAAVDGEAGLLPLLARQEVGHQSLAGVDGCLAGVVQQDHADGQEQHPDGFSGNIGVETLSYVEQEEGEDEDDGEGEDEGPSPAVSTATAVRELSQAGDCEESQERSHAEYDGHVGLWETNLKWR